MNPNNPSKRDVSPKTYEMFHSTQYKTPAAVVGSRPANEDERKLLRGLLTILFPSTVTNSKLNTFCQDNFNEVYTSFAPEMSQGGKINILLDHCRMLGSRTDALFELIKRGLANEYAEAYTSACGTVEPSAIRDSAKPDRAVATENPGVKKSYSSGNISLANLANEAPKQPDTQAYDQIYALVEADLNQLKALVWLIRAIDHMSIAYVKECRDYITKLATQYEVVQNGGRIDEETRSWLDYHGNQLSQLLINDVIPHLQPEVSLDETRENALKINHMLKMADSLNELVPAISLQLAKIQDLLPILASSPTTDCVADFVDACTALDNLLNRLVSLHILDNLHGPAFEIIRVTEERFTAHMSSLKTANSSWISKPSPSN